MMMDAPSSPSVRSADEELHALQAAFAAREPWAFEAAYASYRRRLYGAAYGVLHDRGSAEDCVHDVLARLWRHGHAYTPERGALEPFLVVCVRNEALSRRRRTRELISRDDLEISESSPAPDETSVQRIDMARLISHLNEPQQRVIRMAYYDGFTHEQIAKRIGEPVGTIKSRLSNALRALRALLSQGESP